MGDIFTQAGQKDWLAYRRFFIPLLNLEHSAGNNKLLGYCTSGFSTSTHEDSFTCSGVWLRWGLSALWWCNLENISQRGGSFQASRED